MNEIQTEFDEDLGSFIVTLPAFVTLDALIDWGQTFLQALWVNPLRPL